MGSLFLIVNNYSEFQVNIFSNNRDIRKFQSFPTTADDGDPTNIARAMFENSQAY